MVSTPSFCCTPRVRDVTFSTQSGGYMDELPEDVVEASITCKRYLDRYRDRKGFEGYGPNAGGCDCCHSDIS